MTRHKRNKMISAAVTIAVSALVFTGCSNQKLEDQLAYRTIGINCVQNGDYEGAITAFDNALKQKIGEIGETEIDICYYKAAAQYASGDLDGALTTYESLIAYDKENSSAYYLKGCVLLAQGDTEGAVTCFNNAVQYQSDDYELYIYIAENLNAYDLTEQSTEFLNKAFDIKGDDAENLAWRGKIYFMLGEYENAVAELTAALQKGSVTANLYLAQVYDAQGNIETAQIHYQAYVDAGVADSVAMNALAEIEISKGNYAGALEYISQGLAMEYVPNQRVLMQNQMIAYEYTGYFEAAWNVMQEYITMYPEDVTAQREYTFLKNRQKPVEIEAVISTEETTEQMPETTESTEETE